MSDLHFDKGTGSALGTQLKGEPSGRLGSSLGTTTAIQGRICLGSE